MNLKEAYSTLEIPSTSTPEEAKKKFKELAKKFHPDINKDPEAESKFKAVNEAYQVVSGGKSADREDFPWPGTSSVKRRVYNVSPVISKITISFGEAVLGCEKDIKFNRSAKCEACNGIGEITVHNGCPACGGKGKVAMQSNGMIFIQDCSKCRGVVSKKDCQNCQTKGFVEVEASVRVNIPGGVVAGNILNLRGMGNYIGSFGPLEQCTDAHLHIHVVPEPGLSIEGSHVVSNLQLSLREALQGCKKIVNTINGYQDIEVPALSRNKDEVVLPNLGVSRTGNQRVILDVQYPGPDDISEIIDILNNSPNHRVN